MKAPFSATLLLVVSLALPVAIVAQTKPSSQPADQPTSQPADQPSTQKTVKKTNYPRVLMKTSMGDITLELFDDEAPKTVANFVGLAEGTKEVTDHAGKKTKKPYFDGLTFHRVIPKFMAQGGCPLGTGSGDPGYKFEDEINAKALGLDKMKAIVAGNPNRAMLIQSQQQFNAMILQPLYKKFDIKSKADFDKKKDAFQKALKELTVMQVYEGLGYNYDDTRPSHRMLRGTIAMANSGPNTNGSQFFINMVDNKYLNGKHTVFGKVISGLEVVDKMATVKAVQDRPEKPIKILSIRRLPKKGKDGDGNGK